MKYELALYEADYNHACAALANDIRELEKYTQQVNANEYIINKKTEALLERKLFLEKTAGIVEFLKNASHEAYLRGYTAGEQAATLTYAPCWDERNPEGVRAANIAKAKDTWSEHY